MNKLVDIYGFNVINDEIDYESMWAGKILVKKDGSFEGISSYESILNPHFITGNITKKSIDFISLSRKDDEVCKKYNCTKKGSVYDGIYSATDGVTTVPIGECTLRVIAADKIREVTEKEINNFIRIMSEVKENLGSTGRQIYESISVPEVNKVNQIIK